MSWFNFIFGVIFFCFWFWKYMIMSSKETTIFYESEHLMSLIDIKFTVKTREKMFVCL